MTLPVSGNLSLTQVRDRALRDTGNISMVSNRTRDFFRQKTGDITLTDCRNFSWSAGRTIVNQSPASAVRPFHAAYGVDGLGTMTRSVTTTGDRIIWTPKVSGSVSAPGASYMTSFFYVDSDMPTSRTFSLRYSFERLNATLGGGTINLHVQVIGFSNGFLSGDSQTLVDARENNQYPSDRVQRFTFLPDKRYILVSFGAWMSGSGSSQNSEWKVTNMQVDHG